MRRGGKYGVASKEDRTVDGIVFASKKESRRYGELKLLERGKLIRDLELQPKFVVSMLGKKMCTYVADFRYFDCKSRRVVVEDAKGVRTRIYSLKKKLVEAQFGIEIKEV